MVPIGEEWQRYQLVNGLWLQFPIVSNGLFGMLLSVTLVRGRRGLRQSAASLQTVRRLTGSGAPMVGPVGRYGSQTLKATLKVLRSRLTSCGEAPVVRSPPSAKKWQFNSLISP